MGTKKVVKKRGNGTKIAAQFKDLLRALDDLNAQTAEKAEGIAESLDGIHPNWTFPQSALQAALVLKQIQETAAAAYKRFEKQALKHSDASGGFEHGKVAITFPTTSRRSPSWKDEACALAEKLGMDKGEFIEEVQERAPVNESTRVKLTESAA